MDYQQWQITIELKMNMNSLNNKFRIKQIQKKRSKFKKLRYLDEVINTKQYG